MRRFIAPDGGISTRDRPDAAAPVTTRVAAGTDLYELVSRDPWVLVVTADGTKHWVEGRLLGTTDPDPVETTPEAAQTSEPGSATHCGSCGAVVEVGWRFCGECGAPSRAGAGAAAPSARASKRAPVALLGGVAAVVALGIAGFLALQGGQDDVTSVSTDREDVATTIAPTTVSVSPTTAATETESATDGTAVPPTTTASEPGPISARLEAGRSFPVELAGDLALITTVDGRVVGFERGTGTARWSREIAAGQDVRVRIAADTDTAVVAAESSVFGLHTATGEPRWSLSAPGSVSVVELTGGTALVGGGGFVMAVDAETGAVIWTGEVDNRISRLWLIGDRVIAGGLALGEPQVVLKAFSSRDGTPQWEVIDGAIQTRVSSDGQLGLIVNRDGVSAVDADSGEVVWQRPLPQAVLRGPDPVEGFLLMVTEDQFLALELSSGHQRWALEKPTGDLAGTELTPDRTIVGTSTRIMGVDSATGEIVWDQQLETRATILREGTIVAVDATRVITIASTDGHQLDEFPLPTGSAPPRLLYGDEVGLVGTVEDGPGIDLVFMS